MSEISRKSQSELDFGSKNMESKLCLRPESLTIIPEIAGIYAIVNEKTRSVYIGQTMNLWQRLRTHIHQLENEKHYIERMQTDFNKYGKENFKIYILETFEGNNSSFSIRKELRKNLRGKERIWLFRLRFKDLYNNPREYAFINSNRTRIQNKLNSTASITKKDLKRLNYIKLDLEKGTVAEVVAELLDFWEEHHKEG